MVFVHKLSLQLCAYYHAICTEVNGVYVFQQLFSRIKEVTVIFRRRLPCYLHKRYREYVLNKKNLAQTITVFVCKLSGFRVYITVLLTRDLLG